MAERYDVAIIGAYVRNAQEITAAREAFIKAGMAVVFPEDMDDFTLEEFDGTESDYVVVTPDSYGTRDRFEREVFDAVARADVVYCCNPHGSIDRLSAAAAGYAAALDRKIYAAEPIEGGHLHQFIDGTGTAEDVARTLTEGAVYPLDRIQEHSALPDLQRYMKEAATQRRIAEPDALLEQIAEDALTLADQMGEDVEAASAVEDHLGRFLAHIIALANTYDVDLSRAFREHEAELL